MLVLRCGPCLAVPLPKSTWDGTNCRWCCGFRSLLMNLRKLTLQNVAVFLPALQPVATRLHELHLPASCLQGRSDGFLTRGWTALTKLSLARASAEDTDLTQLLNLPALEDLNILNFRHQGGSLQLDQLTGSCPQIRKLMLQQDSVWGREGRGPCCSLLKLGRLADLYVQTGEELLHASLDLDLPASMTTFRVAGDEGGDDVDFFWALREVMKCIRRGAQLRKVTCYQADAYLQPAQWGASLDEQFRRLGGQLSTLQELAVWGGTEQLLIALVAVLSSAPNLTCVKFTLMEWLPCMELPPICSASLVSISVTVDGEPSDEPPPPRVTPLVLTFLPGCTQLQQVLVQITDEDLTEGTTVKIRCHSGSPTCVVPMDVHARAAEQMRVYGYASGFSEVGVQFLPGPSSAQGVQRAYTVLYACHAAGPQQPLTWGHVVVPGFL